MPQACAHRAVYLVPLLERLLRDAVFLRAPYYRVRLPVHFPAVAETATADHPDVLDPALFPAGLVLRLPNETVVALRVVHLAVHPGEIVPAPMALQDELGIAACSKGVHLRDAGLPLQFLQGAVLLELPPFDSVLLVIADEAVRPVAVQTESVLRVEQHPALPSTMQALFPAVQQSACVPVRAPPVVLAQRAQFQRKGASQTPLAHSVQ